MSKIPRPRPVVLCILDGWGHRDSGDDNAIRLGRTPVLDRLISTCPHGLVDASEQEVGLPPGQIGNSEIGHMNIGAGRLMTPDLVRIDRAIETGELAKNPTLVGFIERLKATGGTAHVMGLISPGGVHSLQAQIGVLLHAIRAAGVPVALHAFLDGRDTLPKTAAGYLADLERAAPKTRIATVSGRYTAMDRNRNWDRTALAYETLVGGAGPRVPDPMTVVENSYAAGVTDEFVVPTAIGDYSGMAEGDGLLMTHFRADRVRQILAALLDPDFAGFARSRTVNFAAASGMVEYGTELNRFLTTLFPPREVPRTLGQVVAEAGLRQLRIAETEKYAHVTFFLNGGREDRFPGEERILVPSPAVATYDLKPEMSAPELTEKLIAAVAGGRFDLVVVNYANADMVGHSGRLSAAIQAVEAVDHCLGRLSEAVIEAGGALIVTADHGNVEQMSDPETGQPHTAHTRNKVPVILVNPPESTETLADGRLADIAPTVLELMGLELPAEMTGGSLIRPIRGLAVRNRAAAAPSPARAGAG